MNEDFKQYLDKSEEIGYVDQSVHSITYVKGLPRAKPNEVVVFESGETGQVLSLDREYVEVLMFSDKRIKVGTKVARTGSVLQIPISDNLLGQRINPIDIINPKQKAKKGVEYRKIDTTPLGINKRRNITKPFETGVSIIDLIVPLGKGQRELVVGNRKTGKTLLLLQSMVTQARQGTICIYAGIGKKRVDVKGIESFIVKNQIQSNTLIISASASDPPGLVYITPFVAMTIAEYFRDKGKDVLLLLDDLSAHAKYYREISLLAKRFPGRSSYPGDIFYLHARLLERAGNFTNVIKKKGSKPEFQEVSITCLPVAEIVLGDLSGFIQTNLMAMTDGHVFFDNDLYDAGRRPAVNPFLSVTRVGRQAQTPLLRDINRQVTSFLVHVDKLDEFMHFGAELSESSRRTIAMGERIRTFFDQSPNITIPVSINIVILSGIWGGLWNNTAINKLKKDMIDIINSYKEDENFRKQIDDIVNSSNSFADVVSKVKGNSELIKSRVQSSS